MAAPRTCAECDTPLPSGAPDLFCPTCGFRRALALGADDPPTGHAANGHPPSAIPFRFFGDYELLEQIARGGMGVVFKARQLSLNRTVAVKMILAGHLASETDVRRFRAEAEAAANLQHPNIVAIHEVGEHDGQPYFSMDYVEGQNLAQLVGNTPLPAARAANYLKTIADAVQYAHQQGVLHRDLKPSNVLIDQAGQPRVSDFGLAKRLTSTQDAGLKTQDLTSTGQVLGSPNFMPPEQAAGKHDAIGPASDVYSLGALLYHLLTGRPPFVAESVPATLRLVAESEAVSPRLLNDRVPRDLETICLKCLQKEPQRRYATAQELTEELNRFLRDEPIHARPIGPTARLWRWCRRNRALASAGGAALTLLIVVAIGSPIAALRINSARQRAEANERTAQTEASKSRQVAQFLKDMLQGVGPSVALGRDAKMLREILDKTAERVGKDLTNQPEVEAELRSIIGNTYLELGDYPKAIEMHREALRLRQTRFGGTNEWVAASLNNLGVALIIPASYAEAESILRAALAMRRQLLGNEHPEVATSLHNLAHLVANQGKDPEAETLHWQALAMQERLGRAGSPEVALTLSRLVPILRRQGRLAEAEKYGSQGLALFRKLQGNEHPEVASALARLASILREQGKLPEAEILFRESLELRKRLLGNEHQDTYLAIANVVTMLNSQGKFAEAETLLRENLALRQHTKPHSSTAGLFDFLAITLLGQHKPSEAESTRREALVLRQSLALKAAESSEASALNVTAWFLATCDEATLRDGPRAVELAEKAVLATDRKDWMILDTLAAAHAEAGQFEKAVSAQKEALRLLPDKEQAADGASRLKLYVAHQPYREPRFHTITATDSLATMVSSLLRQGKFAGAEPLAREYLAIREQNIPDAWLTSDARSLLGGSLLGQQKYAEAEPLLLSGYEGLRQREDKIPAPSKGGIKACLERLVQLYEETARPTEAAEWKLRLAGFKTAPTPSKPAAPAEP